MATMASASLYLQSPRGPAHVTTSSSSTSTKLARLICSKPVLVNSRTEPGNAFRGLRLAQKSRVASLGELRHNWSSNVIQAQRSSSIANLGDETVAARNIRGNLSGKEQEVTSSAEENEDIEGEKAYLNRVCDKLIEVFMVEKPDSNDWRKLLAFSETWSNLRPHFFERCKEKADAENDPEKKQNLLRLSRKLKEVDNDMQRHDELLKQIRESPLEIDAVVARRRKDFTGDFFKHLKIVCDTYYNNLEARDELARIGAKCLTAVEAYDNAAGDHAALSAAQLKFDDILNSPSLEAAAKKLDNLAKQNQLDSSMMLLITKAWASAKESTMVKDEVKDIMYHLYMVARGSLQQRVPKEVRIMKYLLTFEDPQERFAALAQAFSPGDEKGAQDVDMLYTTPQDLHKWIVTVLDAYYNNKHGTLIQEARKLMKPMVIQRLEVLKAVVEAEFM